MVGLYLGWRVLKSRECFDLAARLKLAMPLFLKALITPSMLQREPNKVDVMRRKIFRGGAQEDMRVYLIYPGWPENHWPQGDFRSHWVPSGIAHIAHVLEKEGCEVRILICEEHLIKNHYDRAAVDELIKGELREFMPDMVGFSILTPRNDRGRSHCRLCKENLRRGRRLYCRRSAPDGSAGKDAAGDPGTGWSCCRRRLN